MPRKSSSIIPKTPLQRILLYSGAQRVGVDSLVALVEVLEARGMVIAKRAIEIASHAGRKTVTAADIKLALKK